MEIRSSTRLGGTLQLSVGYLKEKQLLEVSVIQGKNLSGKGKHSGIVTNRKNKYIK